MSAVSDLPTPPSPGHAVTTPGAAATVLLLALAVAFTLAASPAQARVRFLVHNEYRIVAAPTAARVLPGAPRRLIVAGDKGLTILSARDHRVRVVHRLFSLRFMKTLAVGDLNADGHTDIACANGRDSAVHILFGRGGDRFRSPISVALTAPASHVEIARLGQPAATALLVSQTDRVVVLRWTPAGTFVSTPATSAKFPTALAMADLDRDGNGDLVIAEDDGLRILPGRSDGTFSAPRVRHDVARAKGLFLSDITGDGLADLLVLTTGALDLLENRSSQKQGPTFSPPRRIWRSQNPSGLTTSDATGDGRLDVLVTDRVRGTLTVLTADARGTFHPAATYVSGRGASAVVAGDFTGDGVTDAVVVNTLGDGVTLLQGAKRGGFNSTPVLIPDSHELGAMSAVDLDLDGHPDLVLVSPTGGRLHLFRGLGNGRFTAQSPVDVGGHPTALVAGYFTPDRFPDLIVAAFANDAVLLLRGNGNGTFSGPESTPVGRGPVALVTGPFFDSALPDLAVANRLGRSVSLLKNDGEGHFRKLRSVSLDREPNFLLLGDVDNDGLADLVTGNDRTDAVIILPGREHDFGPPREDPLADRPQPMIAEDLDGDGWVDLVSTDLSKDVIRVIPGRGENRFGAPTTFPVGPRPSRVISADFNADGLADLAILHAGAPFISILLNQSYTRPTR